MTEAIEVLNDTSETESEEWDIIQHKDVQISGNTSDAESIEIINDEEAVQSPHSVYPSVIDLDNCSNSPSEFPDQRSYNDNLNERHLNEAECNEEVNSTTTSNIETVNQTLLSGYFPHTERVLTATAGSKDAVYICMAVFVVGLAMLIVPEDDRYKTTTPAPMMNLREVDIASLVKELQVYRESNNNLKLQVKLLTEVVNGLKQLALTSTLDQLTDSIAKNDHEDKNDNTNNFYNNDAFNNLIELINLYKEFSYNPNITKHLYVNIPSNITDDKFKYSSIFSDVFTHMYNESMQNTLELFYKIPVHLKELANIITKHKNIQPFINKWSNKLNKFSTSLENDIRKMKIKFVKHILRSINGMMHSFYKKMCNFEMHKLIKIKECDMLNLTKDWKKNRKRDSTIDIKNVVESDNIWHRSDKLWNNDGKTNFNHNRKTQSKTNANIENIGKIKETDDNVEEIVADDSEDFRKQKEKMLQRKIISKRKYKEISIKNRNFKEESSADQENEGVPIKKFNNRLKRNLDDSINHGKNGKIKYKNNSEQLSESKNGKHDQIIDSNLCKKGFLLKCNATHKSDDLDVNWFLNVGNQRSKIRSHENWFLDIGSQRSKLRSHQSRVDWLFDRAKARRQKTLYDNQRQHFHERHTTTPPLFKRSFH